MKMEKIDLGFLKFFSEKELEKIIEKSSLCGRDWFILAGDGEYFEISIFEEKLEIG